MQVPIRKGDSRVFAKPDPYLTAAKFAEMQEKLARLKARRPILAEEVKRLAEMGDFSENAGYQLAKGRLRGLNQRILDIENHLKIAVIIEPEKGSGKIVIGSRVRLEREGREKEYTILGATETDPVRGVISYLSPLGAALMGHTVGETVKLELGGRQAEYRIVKLLD